jgi:hypothetical protein
MSRFKNAVLILTMFFVSFTSLYANHNDPRLSNGVVNDDFNQGVGHYDYLPYRSNAGGSIAFHTVLSDYGEWVTVSRFGQVWRPYASADWRPFTNGHWVTTQSGQTWQGYEPWSWAADHYGNWIYTQNFGWVWVPGTTYSPGRVAWSYGQNSIGWTPAPPYGYDYSQGYLGYRGGNNQFSFNDNGFGLSFNFGRQDNRYDPLFYNSAYLGVAPNLWNFVGRDRFVTDNYGGLYLSSGQVRQLFNQHSLFISGRPLQRDRLERIIGRRVEVVPVRFRDITISGQRTHYAIPVGEEDHLRRNSRVVVDRIIAPGFTKRNKTFVGQRTRVENQNEGAAGNKGFEKAIRVEDRSKDQPDTVVKNERSTDVKQGKIETKTVEKKSKKAIHVKSKALKEKHKKNS